MHIILVKYISFCDKFILYLLIMQVLHKTRINWENFSQTYTTQAEPITKPICNWYQEETDYIKPITTREKTCILIFFLCNTQFKNHPSSGERVYDQSETKLRC